MSFKPASLRTNVDLGHENISLLDSTAPELNNPVDISQIRLTNDSEKKRCEWADLVIAGKTNLPLCEWISKNYPDN
jgi:phosphatidylinositol kinase/protein kinase (PI-3  family)